MYSPDPVFVLVRCPACRHVLGEVAGDGAWLRKVCDRCKPRQMVTYEQATGRYLLEPLRFSRTEVVA